MPLLVVHNKIDLLPNVEPGCEAKPGYHVIRLSAKTGQGIEILKQQLQQQMGFSAQTEGVFIARRRHVHALERALQSVQTAKQCLHERAGELMAEDLRHAQLALGEITGTVTTEDLLGKIFSQFCIGK